MREGSPCDKTFLEAIPAHQFGMEDQVFGVGVDDESYSVIQPRKQIQFAVVQDDGSPQIEWGGMGLDIFYHLICMSVCATCRTGHIFPVDGDIPIIITNNLCL
jgi:hypothetical protein